MRRKNKSEVQLADHMQHAQQQKLTKAKRSHTADLEPITNFRAELTQILVVCEGKNTEPSYFNQFRLTRTKVVALGEGYNTVSLVKRAIQLRDAGNHSEAWVVFDKDDFSDEDFHQAIQMARQAKFGVAWSNQSFEYWLILHFDDHQGGGMNRKLYGEKLNSYLITNGAYYDSGGDKRISPRFFDLLESVDPKTLRLRRDLAIGRAKRIYEQSAHLPPAKAESCTVVYELVAYLTRLDTPDEPSL